MPSFKLTPVPYTITHPCDAPCHPTSSRSRLPLKQSHCAFGAPTQPPNSRPCFTLKHAQVLVAAPLSLRFHGWAYPLTPASHSPVSQRPYLPPKQSPSPYTLTSASQTIAILFHGRFYSSFTATSASQITAQLFAVALTSQTIAQLFVAPTHLPNSRSLICPGTQSHRSSPRHAQSSTLNALLPPIQLRRYFIVTTASKSRC